MSALRRAFWRPFLLCLLMVAVPLQGYAASMLACANAHGMTQAHGLGHGPVPTMDGSHVVADHHDAHSHQTADHEHHGHHAAAQQPSEASASSLSSMAMDDHRCAACAACGVVALPSTASTIDVFTPPSAAPIPIASSAPPSHVPGGLERPPRLFV